jgi:2-polyprenyl-3-methyl-5-hydroxy-6-metoxy-1,4-benzoquinol methylase
LVRRYWQFLSRRPETYFSCHRGAAIAAFARRYIPRNANVLDYGCGPGFLVSALLKERYRVAGADLDPPPARTEWHDNPDFLGFFSVADLVNRQVRFDAVFLIEVVEHLYDDDLAAVLANVRSLLNKGGMLFVTTPNNERLEDNLIYYPVDNVVFHRWQHVRNWNRQTLSSALEGAGFDVKAMVETNFLGPARCAQPLHASSVKL